MQHIATPCNNLSLAVDKIRAGNPCEKAERLKQIKENVRSLPKTDILSTQLQGAVRRQQQNVSGQTETKSSTDEATPTTAIEP